MPLPPVLRCVCLSKRFDGIRAIEGIDISVLPGHVCALIGPNGAGKTTVLNVISGLVRADGGQVIFRDRDITAMPMWQIARSGITLLFQDPRVFESLSARENVMLAMTAPNEQRALDGIINRSRMKSARARHALEAAKLLELAGLATCVDVRAGELSFGQQRLLCFARALATQPDLFLLDEPGSGLSPPALHHMAQLIRHLGSLGKAVLMVEHNMRLVSDTADYVYYLADGQVESSGTATHVLGNPTIRREYLGL